MSVTSGEVELIDMNKEVCDKSNQKRGVSILL